MSSTIFYVLLVAGALVISTLAYLARSARHRGSIFATTFTAVIFAVIAGVFASSTLDAQNVTGLLAALGLTAIYVVVFTNSSGGDWSDGGGCGGDGGGGCGGGGD